MIPLPGFHDRIEIAGKLAEGGQEIQSEVVRVILSHIVTLMKDIDEQDLDGLQLGMKAFDSAVVEIVHLGQRFSTVR